MCYIIVYQIFHSLTRTLTTVGCKIIQQIPGHLTEHHGVSPFERLVRNPVRKIYNIFFRRPRHIFLVSSKNLVHQ